MKKLLIVLALLLLVVPILAQDDMDPCVLDPPMEAAEINFMGWAFPITEFFAAELEKCNEVENLTVNIQLLDSPTAEEQANLALAGGGDAPWAILHTTPARIVVLTGFDGLQPLNDLVEKYRDEYNLDDIPQPVWDSVTIDGNIYGVPFMSNTMHLFYRTDIFERHMIEVPTTYDEVMDACAALAENEDSIDLPFTMNLHAGWAWEIEYMHFIRSFGGKYLNDEDNTPAFNSDAGIAALAKMKEVVDACMGPEGLTYSIDDSEIGMETGTLAFVHIWASRAANMDDPEKSDYVGIIGFAPSPAPNPDSGILGGSAWVDAYSITKRGGVDHDLAFRAIMETFDFEGQVGGSAHGAIVRSSVSEAGHGGRNMPAFAVSLGQGVGGNSLNPAAALARVALGNWLPLVGSGDLTPEEALDKAAEEYTAEATAQGYIDG
ncbi:MAG: extracellular solute-binding protein [Chloroflexi bacterium]|nr:extracellular solute-binding protein [Chloroflexota bacterium]